MALCEFRNFLEDDIQRPLRPPIPDRLRPGAVHDQPRHIKSAVRVVSEHLVAGKFTIVDYYADWCGPCLLLGHELEQVLALRQDVALRKVDLVSWETDAAKQVTREFGIRGIPYVRVYGPDGRFLGAVNGNHIGKVRALLVSTPAGDER